MLHVTWHVFTVHRHWCILGYRCRLTFGHWPPGPCLAPPLSFGRPVLYPTTPFVVSCAALMRMGWLGVECRNLYVQEISFTLSCSVHVREVFASFSRLY